MLRIAREEKKIQSALVTRFFKEPPPRRRLELENLRNWSHSSRRSWNRNITLLYFCGGRERLRREERRG